MESQINPAELKEIIKIALIEVLEERQDLLRQVVEEVVEDVGLARAIQEGAHTELVQRDEIFAMLQPDP